MSFPSVQMREQVLELLTCFDRARIDIWKFRPRKNFKLRLFEAAGMGPTSITAWGSVPIFEFTAGTGADFAFFANGATFRTRENQEQRKFRNWNDNALGEARGLRHGEVHQAWVIYRMGEFGLNGD